MRNFCFLPRRGWRLALQPEYAIVAGLSMLLVTLVAPGSPACTGMAMVALGATWLTIERSGSASSRLAVILAHATIYASIYWLFVAATLDAGARRGGLSPTLVVDLALSLLLLAAATRSVAVAVGQILTSAS